VNYLTVEEVVRLQEMVIAQSGGLPGVKNLGLVESAVALPKQTFGGTELYPSAGEKAAALGFSLARNHGFNDGNKRIAHAAMEAFLVLNGYELNCDVDEQERTFLGLAAGSITREQLVEWVRSHLQPLPT
jgi:death on curing protein